MKSTTPKCQISIWMSREVSAALKAQAKDERRTFSQVASYAIMEYIRAQREREQRA